MELKQVIIIRNDLKMPKGKMAAQAAHASVDAVLKSDKSMVKDWCKHGMKKVVLKVDSLHELKKLLAEASKLGLITSLINDAGRTFLAPGTTTALGIGPDDEEKITEITGHLKML